MALSYQDAQYHERMASVRIESLADHPGAMAAIGRWHWDEWGHADPSGSLESWTAALHDRAQRDDIPTAFVALDGAEPVGSAVLVEYDMDTRRDLSPWLAGVFVTPSHRGRGVASALVRHAVRVAARMRVHRLYLYTAPARGLYEKLGWRPLVEEHYEGQPVTIMTIETGAKDG